MEQALIYIASVILSFYLGYKFCMKRNMVKEILEALDIASSFMSNKISIEEARNRFKKIER